MALFSVVNKKRDIEECYYEQFKTSNATIQIDTISIKISELTIENCPIN